MKIDEQLKALATVLDDDQSPITAEEIRDRSHRVVRAEVGTRRTLVAAAAVTLIVAGVVGVAWTRARPEPQAPSNPVATSQPLPPTTLPATVAPTVTPAPTATVPAVVGSSPREPVRPQPGEEIRVTTESVEFGEGLVGGDMARADGRTYVLAGRYETERDLLFLQEDAVLAAFDEAGAELWRADLDGSPTDTTAPRQMVAAAGDVWVWQANGGLLRFDGTNGRLLAQTDLEHLDSMVAAAGALWVVRTVDTDESQDRHRVELVRIDPDMASTTIDLGTVAPPAFGPVLLVAAATEDRIWVPMLDVGVAMVDVDDFGVSVIPRDEIGHDVHRVAVDADATYVASTAQVTAIVDDEVGSTATIAGAGEDGLAYFGHADGRFGLVTFASLDRFNVTSPSDPMLAENLHASALMSGAIEVGAEAFARTATDRNNDFDLRRVRLVAADASAAPGSP